ncbi:MAG: hypothetical protein Q8Q49_02005, partial [bacterium]|nr:hypothetical protein [bacterium]
FSNQFLASLYPETPNNIDGFLRLATSNGLDMVAIQGKLNKDLYALLSFVQWYRNQRFDEYDPYPETVLVRDFLEKFSAAANLIREMKDMGYKVNNLAELFVGMAKSAESIGLRKRAPVQEGKENASS